MMLTASWGPPFDPHSYVSSFRVPSHSDYAAQLGLSMKPEIDSAISRALNSTNEEEIKANYAYVLQTLHDQAVYVPLTFSTRQAAFPAEVQGIRFNTRADVPIEEFRYVPR
jgi:nickel transport system substrate-binding protein